MSHTLALGVAMVIVMVPVAVFTVQYTWWIARLWGRCYWWSQAGEFKVHVKSHPKFTVKDDDAFLNDARHVRSNWVFTGDENNEVNVGGPGAVMETFKAQYGKKYNQSKHEDMASVVCESDRKG